MTRLLGNVDLLGLNDNGKPVGMNPIWGTLIGGGVAAGTSMVIGHTSLAPSLQGNRNLIGLLAGLGASGVLYAMKGTRHAAIGSAIGAVLGAGLGWLEQTLFGTVQLPAATAATAIAVAAQAPQVAAGAAAGANPANPGMGIAQINALNGLGIAQLKTLKGRGMGLATMQPQPRAVGTIPGVAGLRAGAPGQMPANLIGAPSAASQQVHLMGGPRIHNISSSYGATVTGGGR